MIMKRSLLFFGLVALLSLSGKSYADDAVARIYAYDLNRTESGDNYTFTFKANEVPTSAALVFYSASTGRKIAEKSLSGTFVKGENSVTLSKSQLLGGGEMYWGIKLTADEIESFGQVYADASLTYNRAYANVDTHPESDFFGKVYVADRSSTKENSRLYVYNQSYTRDANGYKLGESVWDFGRFDIAENGKLYLSDYGDAHSGCYIVNPSDLSHANQFFAGTRAASGLFTYNSIETGSSLAAVHIYNEGANAKMFAVAEDYTGNYNGFPVAIYNIGNSDGSLKETWQTAPTKLFSTLGNAAQNFEIRGCEKGAWVATSRGSGQNNASATSLRFYDMNGNCTYTSSDHTDVINGSFGGGFTITDDGNTMYLVNGNGNILELTISWSGSTPTLTLQTTHTTAFNAITSINTDYAGNLVVTAGSNFKATNANNQLKLVVYTLPTNDNSCTVPAKKSLKINKPLSGSYNIGGENADYLSLYDAVNDLEKFGMSGNVDFVICSDLTETQNIGLTNNTDYTLTIRPDGTTKRTIIYDNASDNKGPSGNIMIGCTTAALVSTDATIQWASTDTKNIIIDGSYNDDNQQHLEIQGGKVGGVIVVYYGYVTNSVVRNCRLVSNRTTNAAYVAHFRSEKNSAGNSAKAPTEVGFENCYMETKTSGEQNTIYFNGSQTSNANGKPKDCFVRGCEIITNRNGIQIYGANGAIFEDNTFRLQNGQGGFLSQILYGRTGITGTIIVRRNRFIQVETNNTSSGAYGAQAITASGGATSWIIENNYFAGLNAKASAAANKNMRLVYIRCGNPCVIRHNTFYMPSLSYKPSTAMAGTTDPISCVYIAAGSPTIQNNIFVSEEETANNSHINGDLNDNVSNNVFYHHGGNCAIIAITTNNVKKTWAEFTAGGANAGSKWASPVFSNAATGDLGIVEANADLMVARLNDVLKDMFDNDRNNPTYAGACEPVAVTAIAGVPATLTLEDINDTHTFTATVEPTNTSFPTITWSSNNESVATVSAAGVVTAQGAGTATVTATAGGFSVNCLVTVNAAHSLSGTYRIGGANADFASLHAACEQINTYGLKDNTTLLICADLTESQNSCLVNTSDYTLTIRPDADVDRTISFTQASDNVGPSGAFVIGLSNLAAFTAIPTKNIVIDGLASNEATHRMTIKTPSTYGSLAGPIIFYGHVTNSSIKNCIVINEMVHLTKNIYGITFRNEKNTDNAPEGVLVENNLVIVTAGKYGHCINFNGQEASTKYAGAPKNNIVRNNELQASTRAVFLYGANGATIEGNTIKVNYAYSGVINHGVMGLAQTGIITVRNNKFLELKTANTADENGIRAITATGGASKWIIENNYFGGLEATENVASKNVMLEYIYCDDLCEIRHNTFYMPSLSHSPATALNSATPVSCVQLKSSAAHIVKNNIFVSEETTAHNSLISGTLNDNILSNVFYHHGGNAALTSGESTMDNLDASNKWMPIAFTETYKLDFESANNSLIAVTPISGITTDIEGSTRTNPTHAGCYEPSWGLILNEESEDNADAIDAKDGQTMDVLLKRHFLVDDGLYTLVLPFDLDNEQLEEAFGVGYKLSVMQTAYFKTSDALYLKFGFVDHLDAGVPCLLRVGNDVTEDILFRDVTIDNADPVKNVDNVVQMRGLYDMTEVPAAVTNYYLGTDDYLFRYKTAIDTKAFRSYFYFPGFATSAPPRVARVIFREDVATDDLMIEDAPATAVPEKIIRDGEMLIIVDGVEYDMMGRPRVR